MSACTTSPPLRSVTLTGTTRSNPLSPSGICAKSGGSNGARARSDVEAFPTGVRFDLLPSSDRSLTVQIVQLIHTGVVRYYFSEPCKFGSLALR